MKLSFAIVAFTFAVSACASAAVPTLDFENVPEFVQENIVPVLGMPAGAQPLGGGGGGGGNAAGLAVAFSAPMSREEVYEHYSDQLTMAGWRFISNQDTDEKQTSFWELTDEAGAIWPAKLEIMYDAPIAPDAYSVSIFLLLPQQ